MFLTIAGLEVRKLATTFTFDTYDNLILHMGKHLQPIKSMLVARHKFFNRIQNSDEDVPTYISILRDMAADCEFEDCKLESITNQLIRDQLIKGSNSLKVRESLLSQTNVSLEKFFRLSCLVFSRHRSMHIRFILDSCF